MYSQYNNNKNKFKKKRIKKPKRNELLVYAATWMKSKEHIEQKKPDTEKYLGFNSTL
jgi:hypothetical protein